MAKNNKSMQAAKVNKNDEFYTRLEDIEDEISMHEDYVRQFEGKTVYENLQMLCKACNSGKSDCAPIEE